MQISTTNTMPENKHLKGSDSLAPPPPPPLPNHRRPRVREVSSRFMSPSPAVSSVQRRQHQRSSESDDENSESSFPIGHSQRKNQRVMKLFKESTNEGFGNVSNPYPSKSCSGRPGTPCPSSYSRPDTPTPSISVSSRYRLTPHHHHQHHNHHSRSINGTASAAAKMLQFSGMSLAKGNVSSNSHDDSSITCSTQSLPELCSETDRDTVSIVAEKIGSSSSLSRSVSLSSSGIDHLLVKGSETIPASVSKQYSRNVNHSSNFGKLGGLSLPPVVPQCSKPSLETRKWKKGSGHEEDVHSLRLFHNKHLQWRFANAKAASAMKAQQKESEV